MTDPKRAALWLVLTLVGLFVVLAAINIPDEDLTPQAQSLLAPVAVATPPEKNGFFLFVGLAAPARTDAHRWGQTRVDTLRLGRQWKDTAGPEYQKAAIDPPANFPCHLLVAGASPCLSMARSGSNLLAQWLEANAERVERYRTLRSFEVFEDTLDPPASSVGEALHRAALMRVVALVEAGNAAEALRELQQEIDLYRRMLASARGVAMKMAATAASGQNYLLLAILLEERPAVLSRAMDQVQQIARPLSARELDMAGVLRAEYGAIARTMMKPGRWADWTTYAEHPLLRGPMPKLFYKPQATVNLWSSTALEMLELAKLPSWEFQAREQQLQAILEQRSDVCCSPYNPAGRITTDMATPGNYLERIHDLDALIRLVSLQAQITAKKVGDAEVPAFLAQSPPQLVDPYTGKPMQWDAAARRLSFQSRQLSGVGWMPKRSGRGTGRVSVAIP